MPCPAFGPFTGIKGLQFYRDNDDDPYITLKEVRSIAHVPMHLINMQTPRTTKNSSARKTKSCQQITCS
jgi:hypothetical protein